VLEEWRSMRQAGSRASQALWELMHQGSKYADRMPIGQESVIRGVSAEVVKRFYQKWYHPGHMAVIVVGDFEVRN
jgi:zinc protease